MAGRQSRQSAEDASEAQRPGGGWHGGGEGTLGVRSQGELVFMAQENRTRELFGSAVKRRGGQNNPLWRETIKRGMASMQSATYYRDHL